LHKHYRQLCLWSILFLLPRAVLFFRSAQACFGASPDVPEMSSWQFAAESGSLGDVPKVGFFGFLIKGQA
jgi:hypothetical protein